MKRADNLYSQICEWKNLEKAYYNACRHKRLKNEIYFFSKFYFLNMNILRESLLNQNYKIKSYRYFKITDPKERLISAASFEDRIVHHAVINILEPIFERQFIYHTYGCRKGKGTRAAILYTQKKCIGNKYYLKLDVKKFFDNINHDILKYQLARIIKDKLCLDLLSKIIDSYNHIDGKSLPIGNLTSQYFANYYLSCLDHYILEFLKPNAYVRYMDDMILIDNSVPRLKIFYKNINEFCNKKLELKLKQAVYGKTESGVPFLGCLIFPNKIKLLKSKYRIKLKKIKRILYWNKNNMISSEKTKERITAILAGIKINQY